MSIQAREAYSAIVTSCRPFLSPARARSVACGAGGANDSTAAESLGISVSTFRNEMTGAKKEVLAELALGRPALVGWAWAHKTCCIPGAMRAAPLCRVRDLMSEHHAKIDALPPRHRLAMALYSVGLSAREAPAPHTLSRATFQKGWDAIGTRYRSETARGDRTDMRSLRSLAITLLIGSLAWVTGGQLRGVAAGSTPGSTFSPGYSYNGEHC